MAVSCVKHFAKLTKGLGISNSQQGIFVSKLIPLSLRLVQEQGEYALRATTAPRVLQPLRSAPLDPTAHRVALEHLKTW